MLHDRQSCIAKTVQKAPRLRISNVKRNASHYFGRVKALVRVPVRTIRSRYPYEIRAIQIAQMRASALPANIQNLPRRLTREIKVIHYKRMENSNQKLNHKHNSSNNTIRQKDKSSIFALLST